MKNKGYSLVGILIAIGIVILLVVGGFYLRKVMKGDSEVQQQNQQQQQQNNDQQSLEDRLKDPVTATRKRIRLVSPNGGQTLERNKQYNVRWVTDLSGSVNVNAVIFKSSQIISDPYATKPGVIAGVEMFPPTIFPVDKNEGSYTYRVPESLAPGKYQILLWAGDNCSSVNKQKRCEYDLSDGFITIK